MSALQRQNVFPVPQMQFVLNTMQNIKYKLKLPNQCDVFVVAYVKVKGKGVPP
jgi:hypothetical protein